jgi:hypothetical protein
MMASIFFMAEDCSEGILSGKFDERRFLRTF